MLGDGLDECVQSSFPIAFQEGKIKIKNVIKLRVKAHVVRDDAAVARVPDQFFNSVLWVRRIPRQVPVALARITVLLGRSVAFVTHARAKQVVMVELLRRVGILAVPMLDLHQSEFGADSIEAIAAQPALLTYQRCSQSVLI